MSQGRHRGRPRALEQHLRVTRAVSTREDLCGEFGESALRQCVAAGTVARVLRGIYAHASVVDDSATRVGAAALWAEPVGAITGHAAWWLWKVQPQPPSSVAVRLPPSLHREAPGWLRPVRLTSRPRLFRLDGAPVVSAEDAAIDVWNSARRRAAVGTMVDAVVRGRVRADGVRAAAGRVPRVRARSELGQLLDALDGGIESFLEHHAYTVVFPPRLFPHLRWQDPVVARGRRRRLDAFDVEARLALEFDGRRFHSGQARLDDIERDADLATLGIAVVRFSYDSLMRRPAWCRETYRAARGARLGG